jgi:integrase/recombinase XerD
MHEAIVRYRNYLKGEGYSPRTVKQYSWHIQNMLDFIDKEIVLIEPDDLLRFRSHLALKKDYGKNSLSIATAAMKSFFSYYKRDTASSLTPPRRKKSLPKYLNETETHQLLRSSEDDPRDHAILMVLCYTGLRVTEASNLNCEDIDLSERTIQVVSGKGDKDRLVVFEAHTALALRRCLEYRDIVDHDALFLNRYGGRLSPRSIERMVQKYSTKAGIKKHVSPHMLRHTLATTLLRHGADIRIIQQLLGHSSVATTQIYTHVDEVMLKTAYEKAAPTYGDESSPDTAKP